MGKTFKCLGLLFIMAALLLSGYNLYTDYYYGYKANQTADIFLEEIDAFDPALENGSEDHRYSGLKSIEIDNERYVGIIEMPSVGLSLPVLKDVTEESLNIGPGVYTGTPYDKNFVIGAHNRLSFFRKALDLKIGDTVYFMDIYKNIFEYQVVERDMLSPENVLEMANSGFDLSLFTCDFTNTARITIRLNKISEDYAGE